MVVVSLGKALLLSSVASALQLPLSAPQAPVAGDARELVNSAALQQRISPDNLLGRAKELYRLAETTIDEYGHPTRVIGSQGRC